MGGGFAPRFTVEAAFLILLAVGAGFADLRPLVIVAVMAGGWVLVSLIEYFAWRASVQTVLRVAVLPQPPEPAPGWGVEDILVPESELAEPEPEPVALTTVLPPEPTGDQSESEPGPEQRRRRWFRRRKAGAVG